MAKVRRLDYLPRGLEGSKIFERSLYLQLTGSGQFVINDNHMPTYSESKSCKKQTVKATLRNFAKVLAAKLFLKFYALAIFSSSH